MKRTIFIILSLVIASLTGCSPKPYPPAPVKKADLIPIPDPRPGYGFCKILDSGADKGKLMITIKNQGNVNAPASVTNVVFSSGDVLTFPTPAIPAGFSLDLTPQSIPAGAWRPDASFKITVDAGNKVDESDEENNTGTGSCLG